MYTFTVQVQFSDEVLATAESLAARFGEADKLRYLEDKIDDALEGGHFKDVTVTLTES